LAAIAARRFFPQPQSGTGEWLAILLRAHESALQAANQIDRLASELL
jgi:hypothetical protein